MNKAGRIFFIVLFLFAATSSLSYSDGIDLDEAKSLSDKYVSYVITQDYEQCYSMMDPIIRKAVSRNNLENVFIELEKMFGKIVSFEYSRSETGWKIYPEYEGNYPLIKVIYMGKIEGSDEILPVHVEVVLIKNKLWVSSYRVFPKEWEYKIPTQ